MQNHKQARLTLSILMVFSLISATISPACAFMSGQNGNFLEICTSQGIKKIPMPEGLNEGAFASDEVPAEQQTEHTKKLPCLFCFATQTHQVLESDSANLNLSTIISPTLQILNYNILKSKRTPSQHPATGPPKLS